MRYLKGKVCLGRSLIQGTRMILVLDANLVHTLLRITRRNRRLSSNCIFPRDGLKEMVRDLRKSKETSLPHAVEVRDHVHSSQMTSYSRVLGIARRVENEMTSIGTSTIEMPS